MSSGRRGVTLIEILFGVALFVIVIAVVGGVLSWSNRSSVRVTDSLTLRQGGRKAVALLLTELQEGMEVLSPPPGSTLAHALVRDQVSVVRWFYLLEQQGKPGRYELWRFIRDPKLPEQKRAQMLLADVKRLTFTSRSEGALQVNLTLGEEEQEYSILTTVRLRNLASSEELW